MSIQPSGLPPFEETLRLFGIIPKHDTSLAENVYYLWPDTIFGVTVIEVLDDKSLLFGIRSQGLVSFEAGEAHINFHVISPDYKSLAEGSFTNPDLQTTKLAVEHTILVGETHQIIPKARLLG